MLSHTRSMSSTPVITFLISTYNRRAVLLRTLRELASVSAICSVSCETIVVDNASRDGTADSVAVQFPEVRLIRRRSNRGACAKNAGLAIARGQYIVFLDDDSFPTVESIGRMIRHFESDPRLGAAVFDIVLPDGSRECSAYPNVLIGCGTGLRREALEEVGGLPDDYFMQAEEYDLSLRLLDAGWDVRRFDDLLAHHLKTPGARVHARTTRLDVRNNLTLIFRRFPRRWMFPFAIDWLRRYRWIAKSKGPAHVSSFWRGVADGLLRWARWDQRQPISDEAFERFSRVDAIAKEMESLASFGCRSILLLDVGKNILPYWLAAQSCGLRIVAIADPRLAAEGRTYRGIPVIDDDRARRLFFNAAVIANVSPVHAARRALQWRQQDPRPVIDILSPARTNAIAA
jgi:GT2 family glycosyltransferase